MLGLRSLPRMGSALLALVLSGCARDPVGVPGGPDFAKAGGPTPEVTATDPSFSLRG